MKKRLAGAFLALVMVLSLLPVSALAAGSSLPEPAEGVITLTEDVTLTSVKKFEESITLDLNGYTLTLTRLDVADGATVTITDSSTDQNGKISSTGSITSAVWSGGTLILDAGTIENTVEGGNAVFNMGTLTVNGGTVTGETGVYNTAWNGTTPVEGNIVCNIAGGTVDARIWGVCVMGPGIPNGDLSAVDNTKLVVNISSGTIIAEQGIAGNASSGTRAGFTVNMTGGIIRDHDGEGTGMYLPSIGITNISGGSVSAAQAIRIGAGELNVTGGTITCTAVTNGEDLIPGGSGGTTGAIVVGKASTGYVGDIKVNVSGNAIIENTAQGTEDDIYPTIVVSDKNMANTSDQKFNDPGTGDPIEATYKYSESSTSVVVNAQVTGDIVKISALEGEPGSTQDGGNTTLEIAGGTVTGNVINQTTDGNVTVSGGTVTGNVTNSSAGEVMVSNATVTGTVSNSGTGGSTAVVESTVGNTSGTVTVVNSKVDGIETTTENVVAMIGAKGYTKLQDAIDNAASGATVTLLQDTQEKITVASGDNLILELNGHWVIDNVPGSPAALTNNGTITIQDSVGNGGIKRLDNPNTSSYYTIKNEGTMTITGGTVYNDSGSTTEWKGSSLICNGASNNAILNISGGTFRQDNFIAVKNDEKGTLNITGGTIQSNTQAVQNWCVGNISGGTMIGDVTTWAYSTYDGETTISGSAYIDGDVTACWFDGGSNAVTGGAAPEVNITGGTVTGSILKATTTSTSGPATSVDADNTGASINVTGGAFGLAVNEHFLDSSMKVQLKSSSDTEAPYSYYTSLAAAQAAAQPGDTITDLTATTENTVTLTLKYDDGVTADTTYAVTANTPITLPTPPTRVNYTFQGWYDASGNKVEGTSYPVTANTTLTARWTYNGGGGSSTPTYSSTVESSANGSVSLSPKNASKGATVTITVTPDEGYMLDTLTVTDKDGKAVEVTKTSDGKYTFKMPGSAVTVKATFAQKPDESTMPFTDVAESAWYYDAVVYVYANGMMTGTNDGTTFSPFMNLTRGMMAQVLYNIEKGTAPTTGSFTDVAAGAWYADAVNWAASKGIVGGYGNGTFGPEDSITREQMAVLLYNYASFKGNDMTASADLSAFADGDQVSGWAKYAMNWAVAEGLIQGSNNSLNPQGTASRAEVAQILMNYFGK